MAAVSSKRTLHATIIPPGAAHVDAVISAVPEMVDSATTMFMCLATMGSLLSDFFVKISGVSDLRQPVIDSLPTILWNDSSLNKEMIVRTTALLCVTDAFDDIIHDLVNEGLLVGHPVKRAADRRRLEIEIDALVAIAFSVSIDDLCTIYRTQFPVLRGYEQSDLYDVNGRKVPGDINKAYRKLGESLSVEDRTWTHPQSQVEYVFEFPFRSFDREEDMRTAYAHFEKMLESEQS